MKNISQPSIPTVSDSGASGGQQAEQETIDGEVLPSNTTQASYRVETQFISTLDDINTSRTRGISSESTMLALAQMRDSERRLLEKKQELTDARSQLEQSKMHNTRLEKDLAVEIEKHAATSKTNWLSSAFLIIGGVLLAIAFYPKGGLPEGRDWVMIAAASICYIVGFLAPLISMSRSKKHE